MSRFTELPPDWHSLNYYYHLDIYYLTTLLRSSGVGVKGGCEPLGVVLGTEPGSPARVISAPNSDSLFQPVALMFDAFFFSQWFYFY